MSSQHNEDREAVEQIRHKWFGYLGSDIDGKALLHHLVFSVTLVKIVVPLSDQRQKKLEDLLPLLTADGQQEMRPPPVVRPTSARDLCERFTKAMELVHANMAFSAKA